MGRVLLGAQLRTSAHMSRGGDIWGGHPHIFESQGAVTQQAKPFDSNLSSHRKADEVPPSVGWFVIHNSMNH